MLYIAMSLDGYIAKPGDDLNFLSVVHKEGEDYGYTDFIRSVDTVIMGRKTYDWIMKQVPVFPHASISAYIITHTPRVGSENTTFYTGAPHELVARLKHEPGKNIFIDGGAEIVNILLKHRLIDEMIVSVIPMLVGNGIRLFGEGRPEQSLKLQDSRKYDTGLAQLHYILTGSI